MKEPLRGVPTGLETAITAEQLAQLFHETYERLAPQFGYVTRKASAKPWADVPDQNKALMTAVCAEVNAHVREAAQRESDNLQRSLDSSKSPCGHFVRYAHTEDGGKHIDCYVCQLNAAERKLADVEKVLLALFAETCGCSSGDPNWHSPRCRMPKIEAALASLRAESEED